MSGDAASQQPEPLWHLLPGDPIGFFGLQPGFDRKDLKRAYNTWLRRYKPDKFPQEFQKLRAAFEQLDSEMRYGQSTNIPVSRIDQLDWAPSAEPVSLVPDSQEFKSPQPESPQPISEGRINDPPLLAGADAGADASQDRGESSINSPATPQGDRDAASEVKPRAMAEADALPASPARPAKTLAERIQTESLIDLYEELKLNPRQPFDYYALALLSDAVAEPESLLFLDWLLKGIRAFPGQPELSQLLLAYFQHGDLPDAELATVLVRVSKVIATDRFYFVTEKLFDRLTLTVPWSVVEDTLKQCSANINDHQIRSKVVFTCHLIRRALWLAPAEKCQSLLEFVNQNYEYLEGNLEYEQELNSLLHNYVMSRERFIQKGPIAVMMDQALRSYCLDIDGRGDYEFVKTQAYIAQYPEQLFREFRLIPEEDKQQLIPWIWVSDEVEDRLETQVGAPKPERLMAATFQMLQQIDLHFPLAPIQLYNFLNQALPMGISLILIIGLPALIGIILERWWPAISVTAGFVLVTTGVGLKLFYWMWLRKRTTSVWLINYLRRSIEKQYLSWWRSLIGRFFAATHFSYADVDRAIDAVLELRRSELSMCNWLPHFYSRDPALYVYATAVRFLR